MEWAADQVVHQAMRALLPGRTARERVTAQTVMAAIRPVPLIIMSAAASACARADDAMTLLLALLL